MNIEWLEERYRDLMIRVTDPLPDKPQGVAFFASVVLGDIIFPPMYRVFG
jgi:hypothetical protein